MNWPSLRLQAAQKDQGLHAGTQAKCSSCSTLNLVALRTIALCMQVLSGVLNRLRGSVLRACSCSLAGEQLDKRNLSMRFPCTSTGPIDVGSDRQVPGTVTSYTGHPFALCGQTRGRVSPSACPVCVQLATLGRFLLTFQLLHCATRGHASQAEKRLLKELALNIADWKPCSDGPARRPRHYSIS